MGGGLLQLVAYGAQDAYLSGNPQITFWKGLFKRHTNFAMEPFRVNLTGQANWGVKHSAILGRHADLLYSTYIEVVIDAGVYNCDQGRLGYNLIKYVELDIGGQLIDRLYGEWLFLWDTLTNNYSQSVNAWNMVNGGLAAGAVTVTAAQQCNSGSGRPSLPTILYIPLTFFYTKNPGAALPLIALQYHEVKINIQWQDQKFIAGNFTSAATSTPEPLQAAIYVDYIYLDTEERRRMAQQSHEYLIEQTQYNEDKGISSYSNRIDLTFNHPVKELVWVVQPTKYTNCNIAAKNSLSRLQPFTYDANAVYEQSLQINGQDRLDKRYGDYFHKVQMYQHHSGGGLGYYNNYTLLPGIYMYSFALRPEEHQPSGTCNFSRIDTATLVMALSGDITVNAENATDDSWDVRVYAVNYNILRVMSGMGGLAYSN
jgi:Large eukaryotic DNA virus major capsid protein/Major capsid protein N-terminus